MSFVAGPYQAVVGDSPATIGISEDGFDLDDTRMGESIRGDNLGSADQDWVYRAGNVFLSYMMQEWNAAGRNAIFRPWISTFGAVGQVGILASSKAQPIVLTVVAGTTAAAAGPATLTSLLAILARDFNLKQTFSTRHRKVAIRQQFLPSSSYAGGVVSWYTGT